jgi:hypothetical protein
VSRQGLIPAGDAVWALLGLDELSAEQGIVTFGDDAAGYAVVLSTTTGFVYRVPVTVPSALATALNLLATPVINPLTTDIVGDGTVSVTGIDTLEAITVSAPTLSPGLGSGSLGGSGRPYNAWLAATHFATRMTSSSGAVGGEDCVIVCDTGATDKTLSLPSAPANGRIVMARKFAPGAIGNLVVERSGKLINGAATDLTLDSTTPSAILVYSTSSAGWWTW